MKTASKIALLSIVILSFFIALSCVPTRFSENRIVMSSPLQVIVYAPAAPDWEGIFAHAQKTADLFDHRLKG